jgi:hypothetical protein
MNKEIELHDSELSKILPESNCVKLFIKGIMHYSDGKPGVDSGTCWLQNMEFNFTDISSLKIPNELPDIISEGRLFIDGNVFENMFELPINLEGKIEFDILTMKNEPLNIKAGKLSCTTIGEAKYLQDFPGL